MESMDRKQALSILKLSEAAAQKPGRIEARLVLLRESLAESNPGRLAEAEAAAELLLFPQGRPGPLRVFVTWLGWRKALLLGLLGIALGLHFALPWLHPDASLERVPPLLAETVALAPAAALDALEAKASRVLALVERGTPALDEATGSRRERLAARWTVELDRLLGALLQRAFHEGRHGRADPTRRVLVLYRRAHDLRTRVAGSLGGKAP